MCHSKDKPKHSPSNKQSSTHPRVAANTVINDNAFFNQEFKEAVFNSLCILSSSSSAQPSKQSVTLDHHLYNQLTDTWVKQASKLQPFINAATTLSLTDIAALGFSTSLSPRSTTLSVMADTGCKSCLAGINTINHLGITAKDLIPVTMQMHAANNVGINILGTAILRFSGHSPSGQLLET